MPSQTKQQVVYDVRAKQIENHNLERHPQGQEDGAAEMNNKSNPQGPTAGAQPVLPQFGSQSEQQKAAQVPTLETLPTGLPGLPAQEGVPLVLEDCRCHHSCCKSARLLSRCYQEWQNQDVQWSQHRSPILQVESRTTSMKYEAGRKQTSASTSGRMKKSSKVHHHTQSCNSCTDSRHALYVRLCVNRHV